MSVIQRRGTVSKSSGPVHVNSYALKGVPIKYTPPFFLPDLLTLPPSWSPPTLPSDDIFRYDYSREKQVLQQARVRTMSLAAEAQAREEREQEEEKRRRIEAAAAAERAKVTSSSATLPPPLIPSPGSAILTPTPAPSHTHTITPLPNGMAGSAVSKDGATNILVKDSTNVLTPLGEMSLSEFEDDNCNPFDAASLQAINDMEILQTISLFPLPGNSESPPSTASAPVQVTGANLSNSSTNQGQNVVKESRPSAAVNTPPTSVTLSSGAVGGTHVQQVPLQFAGPSPLSPVGTPPKPAFLPSSVATTANRPGVQQTHSAPLPIPSLPTLPVLPPIGTNLTHSHSEPTKTNTPIPHPVLPPRSNQPPPTNPLPPQATLPAYPPRTQGTNSPLTLNPPLQPPTSNPPLIPPSPPVAVSSAGPTVQPVPLPRATPYPTQPHPVIPQPQPVIPTQHTLSNNPTPHLPPQPVAQGGGGGGGRGGGGIGSGSGSGGGGGGIGSGSGGGGGNVGTLVQLQEDEATPPLAQSATQKPPVPKPRTFKTAPALAGQQLPNNAHPPYPVGSAHLPAPPSVAPKPSTSRSSVRDRATSLMASLPQGQPAVTRPGLGVPVLPPITSPANPPPPSRGHSSPSLPPTSSALSPFPTPYSPPPSVPPPSVPTPYSPPPSVPPPYPQSTPTPNRSNSPPPPYYPSQDTGSTRRFSQPVPLHTRQHTPSRYTLPDPQSSLSGVERREVESIAGMGFPAPRVARAVKRFEGDRTKVVDFLILVGGVEESSGSRGDSAETALTVCDGDDVKARRYLQKMTYYRESGFDERSIHEAYEQAGKDWDKALDILTQNS